MHITPFESPPQKILHIVNINEIKHKKFNYVTNCQIFVLNSKRQSSEWILLR